MNAVALRCGTLHLDVTRADLPLDELCGFASRRSRKRGFVFVSKVLGKHYPVRPSVMVDVHQRLAARLAHLPGPALLIALAETATGLGQGIYEAWLQASGRSDVLFLHTTRYWLDRPVAMHFEEPHSHATQHLVYEPSSDLFRSARTLVLVDDEMSTGRTLANLTEAYYRLNPNLAEVHLVCLTDWMGPLAKADFARRAGLPTTVHSLLEGTFRLDENTAFDPGPAPNVTGQKVFKDRFLPRTSGRLGVLGLSEFDLDGLVQSVSLEPGQKVLVLGSGEFSHPPFLLARRLEQLGWDVHFQATTRSPLLVDADIRSVLEFCDNYHDEMSNYIYNVTERWYDKILVGYETRPLPANHTLPAMIGALPIFFDECG